MSKEKTAAWRSMRKTSAEDARTMREMHENQTAMRDAAPRVTDVPEDAMHTLWRSDRKRLMDGKWYVPLSEVSDVLTAPTEDPLSEEWQAQCFPNLNIGSGMGEPIMIGGPTPEEDSKRWIRVPKRFKQETRLRIPDRY